MIMNKDRQDFYLQKMTPSGYQKINAEIAQLDADRPAKIKALQKARALGDLSENADYSAAKRDLRHLESRLRFLHKQLRYADVITPQDNGKVELGTYVTLRFDDGAEETFRIVGKQEVDVDAQLISFASPLGAALMGKKVGTTVTVEAPATTYQVTITKITV